MCTVCGCGSNEPGAAGSQTHEHEHVHADGTVHRHTHDHSHAHSHDHGHTHEHTHDHGHGHEHAHVHEHPGFIDYGCGPAGVHVPGMSEAQLIRIEKDILSKNDAFAQRNRQWFNEHGVLALNLVSSPGSGKTALLVRTIEALEGWVPVTVIEGDQQTSNDAERIRATGVRALQINTGKGCHLDAQMVGHAVEHLQPEEDSVLFIENVGNLVCPAAFDLGEAHKVVILSITEGEDKPLKYPDMFAAADLMLLNKIDLLPHLDFDVDQTVEYARRINPNLNVIQVSATSGEGFTAWVEWIRHASQKPRNHKNETIAKLRERISQLEAALEKTSTA